MFQITFDEMDDKPICMNDEEAGTKEVNRLKEEGKTNVVKKRFRGLGSMPPMILWHYCVNPTTRQSETMGVADAEAAIAAFSPGTNLSNRS
jgi:DNA gyrase/topoisomerase IV subunit B